ATDGDRLDYLERIDAAGRLELLEIVAGVLLNERHQLIPELGAAERAQVDASDDLRVLRHVRERRTAAAATTRAGRARHVAGGARAFGGPAALVLLVLAAAGDRNGSDAERQD